MNVADLHRRHPRRLWLMTKMKPFLLLRSNARENPIQLNLEAANSTMIPAQTATPAPIPFPPTGPLTFQARPRTIGLPINMIEIFEIPLIPAPDLAHLRAHAGSLEALAVHLAT